MHRRLSGWGIGSVGPRGREHMFADVINVLFDTVTFALCSSSGVTGSSTFRKIVLFPP
jgi:hypothetical protein